jgi:hypothetical protein
MTLAEWKQLLVLAGNCPEVRAYVNTSNDLDTLIASAEMHWLEDMIEIHNTKWMRDHVNKVNKLVAPFAIEYERQTQDIMRECQEKMRSLYPSGIDTSETWTMKDDPYIKEFLKQQRPFEEEYEKHVDPIRNEWDQQVRSYVRNLVAE